MIRTTPSVRRAKTRRERLRGHRWVAAAEFPGGRKIILSRNRTRTPAIKRAQLNVVATISAAANAGAVVVPNSQTGGGTLAGWKRYGRDIETV